jgi:DNA-binding protein Fis
MKIKRNKNDTQIFKDEYQKIVDTQLEQLNDVEVSNLVSMLLRDLETVLLVLLPRISSALDSDNQKIFDAIYHIQRFHVFYEQGVAGKL